MRISILLCLFVRIDGFSVAPNAQYSRKHCQCQAQNADTDDPEAVTTMSTALCVIPPDEAWDTIQRARHMARDRTYHKWPPAVRLFHPFCQRARLADKALDIARVIEENDIEPFQVTLDSWTIVPHMEAIEADWEAMRQLPKQEKVVVPKKKETEADRLIAEEERLGKQRLLKRVKKGQQTASYSKASKDENEEGDVSRKHSPRELLEKQKQQCMLCALLSGAKC